jgi:EmrB/QacA subfamily drug resistance transporter
MSENSTSTSPQAPAGESATHAHIPSWAVLAIACAAQFMVVLDISIVNVALPKIGQSLSMNQNELQWVVNAYALTFAGFLLLGGRAGDLFGRKRIFLLGLTVFVAASLVGGFAQNGTMLEIARAAQGLGGAILAPSTLSLLTTTYTEQRERARALGLWSATAGSGGAFGVMAGGILTDELSWRWILFVNVPIGAVLFAAAWVSLKESRGQLRTIRALDIPGTITVTGGLAVLVYGIVSTDQHAWGSARTLVTLAIAIVLLGAFVAIERYTSQPLVPLRIFKMRALSSANGIAVTVGALMFSLFFFLSLYMQDVLHFSALKTGFAFVPGALAIIIGAQTASRLVSKVGPRRIIVAGTVCAAIGMWWLSRLPATGNYYAHVLPPLLLVSLGLGLSIVPVTVAATMGVDRKEAGLASGLVNTTRQVGGALGLAALATIATDRSKGLRTAVALSSGFDRAFLVGGFIAVVGALLALTLPGRNAHVAAVEQSARDHTAPAQPAAVAEH